MVIVLTCVEIASHPVMKKELSVFSQLYFKNKLVERDQICGYLRGEWRRGRKRMSVNTYMPPVIR